MEVTVEVEDFCLVARVSGSIEALEGEKIADVPCLKLPERDVVLDLEGVEFLDSLGLGVLVRIIQRFSRHGKVLVLSAPTPIVRKTLSVTGIDRIVAILDSAPEAIRSMER